MYFESHAHYDDSRFDADRDLLLGKLLPEAGINYVVNIGADMPSSRISAALAHQYSYIYAAVGVHPHDTRLMSDADIDELAQLAKEKKVVAIGEIGLDYHYMHSPREIQVKWFERQLELAKDINLPVVIHSREADRETFDIIKKSGITKCVIHCYSGGPELALEYAGMGFYIGVGGAVTYPKSEKLVETVRCLSIEKILLETDCPYLSPAPYRSKRNDSQNLTLICDKIAQIKQINASDAARATLENGCEFFVVK